MTTATPEREIYTVNNVNYYYYYCAVFHCIVLCIVLFWLHGEQSKRDYFTVFSKFSCNTTILRALHLAGQNVAKVIQASCNLIGALNQAALYQ